VWEDSQVRSRGWQLGAFFAASLAGWFVGPSRSCSITALIGGFWLRVSHRRALAAVGMTGLLAIPTAGSLASPRQDLRENRDQLSRVRGLIRAHRSKASILKADIDRLNRRITRLQIALNKLDDEIEAIRGDVDLARARIRRTQREIDSIKDLAATQAVALYKSGGTEALDALLDSASLGELNDRIELLGVAARENTGALIRYGRLRTQIRQQTQVLFEAKRRLDEKRAGHAELKRELSGERKRIAASFAALQSKLAHEQDRERGLEADQEAIKEEILEAQVGAEVAALGVSSEGFTWPVNGAVTSPFGSRWGGMHTGIDIDAYSGQPIAAAKSGVAIYVGSGMSGYGNVVMIDHGGGISTLYAHMSGFNTSGGAAVHQGQIIGFVGCTGNCYGDHLHFEVRLGGNPVDPMGYLP
jgi:murein DD-endopeptidase MepM/ murein hydrolase activator NlpD